MITAVLDTNVVISAIYWPRSTGRRCLAGFARRQYALAVTPEIFKEYEAIAREFRARFPGRNPSGILSWLHLKARWFEPVPLGSQRSRDPRDDPFLSGALAAGAKYLVTRDEDLRVLGKPFGIHVIAPVQFLRWLRETQ